MTDDLNRLRAVTLTDEEERRLSEYVMYANSHGLHGYVESIVAARTAALLDRAERAETERDEWKRRADEERESGGKAFRELVTVIKETEAEWLKDSDALDALRAAVTNLADEWEAAQRRCCGTPFPCTLHESRGDDIFELRSLLAAAPTETDGTPDE